MAPITTRSSFYVSQWAIESIPDTNFLWMARPVSSNRNIFRERHISSQRGGTISGNMKNNQVNDLIRLWVCRIVIRANAIKRFVWRKGLGDIELADFLELHKWGDKALSKTDQADVRRQLEVFLQRLEGRRKPVAMPVRVRRNLALFSKFIKLSKAQAEIVGFLAFYESREILRETFKLFDHIDRIEFARLVGYAIGVPQKTVMTALSPTGPLLRSGFLGWQRGEEGPRDYVSFTKSAVAQILLYEEFTVDGALRKVARPSPQAKLGLDDFPQIRATLDDLDAYLRHAIGRRARGCNVFIYGAPGTGKTELARTLGRSLHCPAYEVSDQDDDGNPLHAAERLESLRLAHSLLQGRRAMLVFDEAEDVFRPAGMISASVADKIKSWINRLLEQNAVPTIWLSNRVDCLDDAFIRRFDFVFELTAPCIEQRRQMITKMCPAYETTLVKKIARCDQLTPAVIARADSVASKAIRVGVDPGAQQKTFVRLLTNTLKAQGHNVSLFEGRDNEDGEFSLRFLNTDLPLEGLLEKVGAASSCRMCLYGPSGTGKTSFGRWFADRSGTAIHTHTASDILSPFHGETERRLARMFARARESSAILMIDEVDSLLADRRHAVRAWEVSEVNEMLAQLENFGGVFIASTNRIESVDAAARRRFDFKIKFDYLTGGQVAELLDFQCHFLGLDKPSGELLTIASRIDNATPGDFRIAARQHRFRQFRDASALLDAVIRECSGKTSSSGRPAGFECR